MKKISTVAMLLALFMAPVAMGATTEEKTTTDESQGFLMNGFWDNWYISVDGGASVFFSPQDDALEFTKRIAPNAALNFGKWWTPIFGTRIGLDYMAGNAATNLSDAFGYQDALVVGTDDVHNQKFHGLRPHLDGMVDLVNLFGGYSPTRVYSLIIYGGFGYGYGWADGTPISDGFWCTELRGGLINAFHVSKHVDINIELKVSKYDSQFTREGSEGLGFANLNAGATIGIAYRFNKADWTAPVIPVVVPVVPKYSDAEGDALVAQLRDANKRIKDLEQQLADCQTPVTQVIEGEEPAVTVYYDINKSTLRSGDIKVLKALAASMKADANVKYVITGYADSQTGTPEFNAKLREARAKAVYNALVNYGVNPSQLSTEVSSDPLNKFSYVLDRAATIKLAK